MYKRVKILFFIVASMFVIVALVYSTDVGYKKLINISERIPFGKKLFTVFEVLFNEVDIIKKFKQDDLPDSDFVDLVLSADDLKNLQLKLNRPLCQMSSFHKIVYIWERIEKWGNPQKYNYNRFCLMQKISLL